MEPGYISVQTHPGHPAQVRLLLADRQPATDASPDGARVRYIARFGDGDAALMHAHEFLHRRLQDLDAHLYHTDLAHAVAAVRSIDLRHTEVYIDPDIDQSTRDAIDRLVDKHQLWRRRREQIFRIVGAIGIGLLLFNAFVLSLA